MKTVLTASISLVALLVLAAGANAQQQPPSTTVTLVQKFHPVTRSYPGVAADLLGIRTGMTVPQAEAIAAKTYPGKPVEVTAQDFFVYRGVMAQSPRYVQRVEFTNQKVGISDALSLYFSSPATGNTLYAMNRDISFGDNEVLDAPLLSAVKASLIKKYGPPSIQSDNGNGPQMVWAFDKKSRTVCKDFNCVNNRGVETETNLALYDSTSEFNDVCKAVDGSPNNFNIQVSIESSGADTSKVGRMITTVWDVSTCVNDRKEAINQLKAAAIEFYKSKSPAAIKL